MRAWLLLGLLLVACTRQATDDEATAIDPGGGSGAAPLECAGDTDCIAVASTCCACPSYALPATATWPATCDQVQCPAAPACDEVRAACRDRACTLVCAPIACAMTCADGFAVDAAGCQVCACAAGAPAECHRDDECARVPDDCCGCARGGADTAVPVDQVAAHRDALACPATAACPGVDVCTPGAVARCRAGQCALVDPSVATSLPAGACGRPELPPCAAGLRCLLNDSPDATSAGVGVCAP